MKFKYLKQPNYLNPQKPWISRPFIPVRLFYGKNFVDVYALVDSGADVCLFHSSLGRALGIEIEAGERQVFYGIEASGVRVYFHKIKLKIHGAAEEIYIHAGFTESRNVSGILGQRDFFDSYIVVFDKAKEVIEIKIRPK